MKAIENVHELESKKLTFVNFEDVAKFLTLCAVIGIAVCGGAFDNAMTGQWFYQ